MEILSDVELHNSYDPNKNVTRNILSRYETAKIIGTRMEQLARGAKPTVSVDGLNSLRDIAMKELNERKIPFMIARTLANGKKEIWKLDDLIISAV
jgi:DNA-directed RNA polymerase subunit K/omega